MSNPVTNIRPYQVTRGTRLAVVLVNGTRIAGKAAGRIRETRGVGSELAIRSFNGGGVQHIDMTQVDTLTTF